MQMGVIERPHRWEGRRLHVQRARPLSGTSLRASAPSPAATLLSSQVRARRSSPAQRPPALLSGRLLHARGPGRHSRYNRRTEAALTVRRRPHVSPLSRLSRWLLSSGPAREPSKLGFRRKPPPTSRAAEVSLAPRLLRSGCFLLSFFQAFKWLPWCRLRGSHYKAFPTKGTRLLEALP